MSKQISIIPGDGHKLLFMMDRPQQVFVEDERTERHMAMSAELSDIKASLKTEASSAEQVDEQSAPASTPTVAGAQHSSDGQLI